jgi:hypothetical protein
MGDPNASIVVTRLPRPRWKKATFVLATIVLVLFVCLLVSEIALRIFWPDLGLGRMDKGDGMSFHELDPTLGWTPKAGHFEMLPMISTGETIHVTNWPGGRRATSIRQKPGRPKLLLVGCSFTQGWAVSDEDTFPWKLQQRFPRLEVQNYGVAGYGTYQCLLLLEKLLAEQARPALVMYGFVDHHEKRNLGLGEWVYFLRQSANMETVALPYCTLDAAGHLQRHEPDHFRVIPLRNWLATAACIELLSMKHRTRGREDQARPVTKALLVAMRDLCRSHGVPFMVTLFRASGKTKNEYLRFLKAQKIEAVDSIIPPDRVDLRVIGDGHPNGQGYELCVENMAPALEKRLAKLK